MEYRVKLWNLIGLSIKCLARVVLGNLVNLVRIKMYENEPFGITCSFQAPQL